MALMDIPDSYKEKRRKVHDNHPEHESASIVAELQGTGLDEDGQNEILKRGAPELVYHPEIGSIAAGEKGTHAKAVAALHDKEQSGGEHENDSTDDYIRDRAKQKVRY